jgi:hypothetical protein
MQTNTIHTSIQAKTNTIATKIKVTSTKAIIIIKDIMAKMAMAMGNFTLNKDMEETEATAMLGTLIREALLTNMSLNTNRMDGKMTLGEVVDKNQIITLNMEYLRITDHIKVIRRKAGGMEAAAMKLDGNKVTTTTIQPTIKDMATVNLTHTTTINTTTDGMGVIVGWGRNLLLKPKAARRQQ